MRWHRQRRRHDRDAAGRVGRRRRDPCCLLLGLLAAIGWGFAAGWAVHTFWTWLTV